MLAKRMLDSNQQSRRGRGDAALAREDAEERAAHPVLRPPVWRRAVHLAVARPAREPEQHHRSVEGAALDHLSGARWLGRTLVVAAAPGLARPQGPSTAGDCRCSVGNHQPHRACGPAQSAGGALDVVAVLRSRRESAPRGPTNLPIHRHRIRFRARATRRGIPAGVRYTQTPPAPEKWRRNEQAVLAALPGVEATWRELEELDAAAGVGHGADG